MKQEMYDFGSERIVISYLLQQGAKAQADIFSFLHKNDFHSERNQAIIACVEKILSENDLKSVTVDTILSTAKSLNLSKLLSNKDDIEYLKICKQTPINIDEIKIHNKKIKFWSIIRGLEDRYTVGLERLKNLSGSETISEVISKAEKDIFDFVPDILNQDDLVHLGDYALKYIDYLANNPVESPGLPSGFPRWDKCIGGGLRRGTVNLLGARVKIGKSTLCLNIAKNLAEQDIPVLYLDTELNKDIQSVKWTSLNSKISQSLIESGQFVNKPELKQKVYETLNKNTEYPFYLVNVSGKSPDEMMSIMRRWLSQYVGRDNNGKTKNCLIILDYLKTMDLGDLGGHQEYQYLGDVMTKLHNFAVRYEIPIISALQLNRDGINREDTGAVAGSDRIVWLCSSLTFLKRKTDEDFVEDDKINGDRKLIVVETRFGRGMDISTEYINIKSNLDCAELVEGKFNYEIKAQQQNLIDDDEEDFIGDINETKEKEFIL